MTSGVPFESHPPVLLAPCFWVCGLSMSLPVAFSSPHALAVELLGFLLLFLGGQAFSDPIGDVKHFIISFVVSESFSKSCSSSAALVYCSLSLELWLFFPRPPVEVILY